MPAAGSGFLYINYTGIDQHVKNLRSLYTKLNEPDMSAPVRGAAKVWEMNYHSEGRLAGRPWQQLAPYTQKVRAERGHSPTHPILRQRGDLFKAAIMLPQGFRGKSMNRTVGTPPTNISIRTRHRFALLTITGYKVENQAGGTTPEGFILPARPFWHISSMVRRYAADELIGTIEPELERFTTWR